MMAVLLMAACTKGIEVGDIPQLDYASVSFSSPSAVFPMEGGEKTIFVVSNREDWEVECDADWLDISVEEHSLTFFVDPNNTKDSRMAVIAYYQYWYVRSCSTRSLHWPRMYYWGLPWGLDDATIQS